MQKTLEELFTKTEKYITAEDLVIARQENEPTNGGKKKRDGRALAPSSEERKKNKGNGNVAVSSAKLRFESYTPLNIPLARILNEIRGTRLLRDPPQMKAGTERRSQSKYCEFHQNHEHWTVECQQLNDKIERLVREGRLGRYIVSRCMPYEEGRRDDRRTDRDLPPKNPHQ